MPKPTSYSHSINTTTHNKNQPHEFHRAVEHLITNQTARQETIQCRKSPSLTPCIRSSSHSQPSLLTSTPLDQPPRHTRKQQPSILLLRRIQLDRRPTASLEQVLPCRAIQVTVAQKNRPDQIIEHCANVSPGSKQASKSEDKDIEQNETRSLRSSHAHRQSPALPA